MCLVGVESPDVTILMYKTRGELQLFRELYSIARNSFSSFSTLSLLHGSGVSVECSYAGCAFLVYLVSAF